MTPTAPMVLGMIGPVEIVLILLVLAIPFTVLAILAAFLFWHFKRKRQAIPPPIQSIRNPAAFPNPNPNSAPTTASAKCQRCGQTRPPNALQSLCPRCVLASGFETAPENPSQSAQREIPPIHEIASHFPQLELLEPLGKGGMGWVYKARQLQLDRIVALKVLPPYVAADPAFAQRFQREARALARLSHPNIVAIYESGQTGPYYFFLMEFVEGTDLRQLLRTRSFTPAEAIRIVPSICDALQFAHSEGIVHRDIKPENILVDSKGRVKIADFGIAKLTGGSGEDSLTQTHRPIGTPKYMAPEQFTSPDEVDHRADLFALGVVFYELLTGELPVGRFDLPSQRVAVDIRVDEVVLKSLEQRPERRYQTASAVKSDVEQIGSTPNQATSPTSASPSPPRAQDQVAETVFEVWNRAWRDTWKNRSRWFTISVQAGFLILHLACLAGFINFQMSSFSNPDGLPSFSYSLGTFEPWFRVATYPTESTPYHSGLDPFSRSMVFLLGGLLTSSVVWALEKALNKTPSIWNSPKLHAGIWTVFVITAVITGLALGKKSLDEGIRMRAQKSMSEK